LVWVVLLLFLVLLYNNKANNHNHHTTNNINNNTNNNNTPTTSLQLVAMSRAPHNGHMRTTSKVHTRHTDQTRKTNTHTHTHTVCSQDWTQANLNFSELRQRQTATTCQLVQSLHNQTSAKKGGASRLLALYAHALGPAKFYRLAGVLGMNVAQAVGNPLHKFSLQNLQIVLTRGFVQ
jgi:hypothetical protein